MSYIGNTPTTAAFLTDQFSGNGSTTTYTMSVAPATTSSIIVAITGVVQDPSTYSVNGTSLTFSAAPPAGTGNISIRYLGIPASGVATTAYRTITDSTATAGQTTFTIPSYTVGYLNVYRNGVRLATADYTASNGTSVVLTNSASAGDTITTESFYVSSVLNAFPTTGGTLSGQLAVNSATGQKPLIAQVNGTEVFEVDASGRVGIATSSPQNLLNIVKDSANSSAAANAGVAIQSDSGATYTAGLHFGTDKTGVLSYIQSDSSASYSAVPLVINPLGGNVGIGTSSPSYKLDVSGAISWLPGVTGAPRGYMSGASADQSVEIGTNTNSPLGFATNAIRRMAIDTSGNLLVGTTSTDSGRMCVEAQTNGYAISFRRNTGVYGSNTKVGQISCDSSSTVYTTSSDYRLKENIAPMTGALNKVTQLKPVTYTWKESGEATQGFIAHELQAVVPDAVVGEKDAVDAEGNPVYQGIDTSFLVATLTAAIQEMKTIIDTQASTITQLQADVAALKGTA